MSWHKFANWQRYARLNVERLEIRELLDGNPIGLTYGQIPLSFEANQGQTDPQVNFLARGSGYGLFLTPTEAVLSLQQDVLRMQLIGGNTAPQVIGLDQQASVSNYFIGNDPSHWRTNVANYGKVEYQQIYPGIDLVYYGNQQQLEYDFVVGPGANPGIIQLSFQGAQTLTLDTQGNLVLHTAGGDVVEHAPVVYQDGTGGRQAIAGRYVLEGPDRVGFQVGAYDPSRPLIIDPVLSYSTYLGGSGGDQANGIAVDASGNAYVTGFTGSTDFPTTPGALQTTYGSNTNAFVAKLNATGTALVYSTYLGGSGAYAYGIAVDASGNAYLTGNAGLNFPVTAGAFQTSPSGFEEAFVAKLNATGNALIYATYLGGSSSDWGYAIAVDASGDAYVTGVTGSNFPTTPGAFQTTYINGGNGHGFVTKLNPTGTALIYSTYLGGSGTDYGKGIALDASGNAYVTGLTNSTDFPTTPGAVQTTFASGISDAFVAKLNATGTALLYSTYLGGSSQNVGNGIAVDPSGNAYVTGATSSSNFPTTPGAVQTTYPGANNNVGFVAKLNAAGTALIYSTYLGGSGSGDTGNGIAVDPSGNAYVTGATYSSNFPTTLGALQTTYPGGYNAVAFVTKLNATGTALLYSTYLGDSNGDDGLGVALDVSGNAYITGETSSSSFPTTPGTIQASFGGGGVDAFVAKIDFAQATVTAISSSANPSIYGQSITLTATVTSGGSPVSTGTVTFQEGNTVLAASVPLDSSGHASFQIATLTVAGSPHTITAYYNGSLGFDFSSGSVNQTVNKAPLLVTADDKTRIYGQANPVFTAHYTGFVLGEDQNVLSGTLIFSTPATATSPVSSYAITPSGLTSSNYAITFAAGTLTVAAAPLTITADSETKLYGAGLPTLTASYNGFVNGDTPASLTTQASLSTNVTMSSPVGSYVISVGGASSPNYTITFVNGNLTVTPDSTATVLLISAAAVPFGQAITLTATVSPTETGSVVFLDQGTPLATVPLNGGTATFVTSALTLGEHSLTASYAGDANHTGSTSSPIMVTVGGLISGTVFHDDNSNGVQDPGEPGIAGQTVFLDLDGSGQLKLADPTAITDANGNYQFTGLSAGTYTVRQLLLGGVLLSAPTSGSYQATVANGGSVTGENFADVLTSSAVPLTLPPSTSFPAQGNGNADYVEALYRSILDRNADPSGLANWTSLLNSGAMSRLQVVQGIRNSPEHFTQEVTDFYLTLLGRAPDAAGLQNWVQQLEGGMREEQMAFYFLDSPEYLSQGDKHFVDAMYLSLLGRSFDTAGESNWLSQLGDDASGNPTHPASLTHEQVIADFLYSTESVTRLTEGYYEVFLQRAADSGGLSAWVAQLQQGVTFLTIGQQFLSSDEFYNRAAQQG